MGGEKEDIFGRKEVKNRGVGKEEKEEGGLGRKSDCGRERERQERKMKKN